METRIQAVKEPNRQNRALEAPKPNQIITININIIIDPNFPVDDTSTDRVLCIYLSFRTFGMFSRPWNNIRTGRGRNVLYSLVAPIAQW